MIKLSSRLNRIADYIDDGDQIVDVGCDHGLLDIYLVQRRKNIKIIASDVNVNALNNAKKNIAKYNLNDCITTVLSDGLDNINMTGINTVVISGMGSHTIAGILYKNIRKLKKVNKLILQSNND